MISGTLIRTLWILSSLSPIAGTTLSGKLVDGITGSPVGGENAFVVAYVELPTEAREVVILGYSHPDDLGKWSIPNLPSMERYLSPHFTAVTR